MDLSDPYLNVLCSQQQAGLTSYLDLDLGYMAEQSGIGTFYHNNKIEDNTIESTPEKPDEFTQLSNHSFHELLSKFEKLAIMR